MLLDVRSIERAYEAVPFFDRFFARDTARVTHAAILNELPVLNGPPGADLSEIDCDELFNDSNMGHMDPLAPTPFGFPLSKRPLFPPVSLPL